MSVSLGRVHWAFSVWLPYFSLAHVHECRIKGEKKKKNDRSIFVLKTGTPSGAIFFRLPDLYKSRASTEYTGDATADTG